jgi:hypothetical protein
VLLELLAASFREWLAHLAAELPSAVRRRAGFKRRAEQLATAISRSVEERPVLCDLMSTQAAVLEHNVSVEAVTRYKLATLADAETLAGLVHDALPELSQDDAWRYTVGAWLMITARFPGHAGRLPHHAGHRTPRPRRRLGWFPVSFDRSQQGRVDTFRVGCAVGGCDPAGAALSARRLGREARFGPR